MKFKLVRKFDLRNIILFNSFIDFKMPSYLYTAFKNDDFDA